jgi:hypothetical protein
VSVLNVVATIEMPISHHGAARPEVKYSAVFVPARRANSSAGRKQMATDAATIIQSNSVKRITGLPTIEATPLQGLTANVLSAGRSVKCDHLAGRRCMTNPPIGNMGMLSVSALVTVFSSIASSVFEVPSR